jgi:hypothetical protein
MPRIYTSANDPLDFCQCCFPPTEQAAYNCYGDVGDGPDGRGNCFAYDAGHPAYECDEYRCCQCAKLLDEGDCAARDYK